jgi:tetratricopeptide (TPR) repeat protein
VQRSYSCWLFAAVVLSAGCAATPPPRTAAQGSLGPEKAAVAAPARGGSTPSAATAPGREPAAASPEQVYRSARDLVEQGHADQAKALLAARVAPPRTVRDSSSEENARLLALLGEITAVATPASEASFFRAEAYLAWAIAADPCMGEYWHHYMRVRLAHVGYSGVLSQIQHREPLRYPSSAIGFSGSTLGFPWTDSWLYLRGLLFAETDNPQRAEESLVAFKKTHNSCPVDQTLGELYQSAGRPREAITYLSLASEAVPGQRSALRHYVLGLARKSLNETALARRAFVEASRLDPTFGLARSELLALDGAVTGDRESNEGFAHRTLSEHPADLAAWLTFWETRYRNGVAPEVEFQRFAREVGNSNRRLSQPVIAQAVSLMWEGSSVGAARLLAGAAADGADDADLWFASFLVAACRGDGPTARQALDRLGGHDGALRDVLERRGAPHVVSLLESAATAQPETLTRVGEFLMSLGVEPSAGLLSRAVAQAWFHGVQGTPEGSRAALDAVVTEVSLLGQRVTVIEKRLDLGEAEIRGLSAGAVRILARVKSVEEGEIRQAHHLVLLDAQVNQLVLEQRDLAQRCAHDIAASEQHLTKMIRDQDKRLSAALDALSRELASHGDQLEELARAAGATQQEIGDQRQRLAVLENWRTQPPGAVPLEATKLSQRLYKWSSIVSIGPSVGFASLNIIGLLAAIADAMGS